MRYYKANPPPPKFYYDELENTSCFSLRALSQPIHNTRPINCTTFFRTYLYYNAFLHVSFHMGSSSRNKDKKILHKAQLGFRNIIWHLFTDDNTITEICSNTQYYNVHIWWCRVQCGFCRLCSVNWISKELSSYTCTNTGRSGQQFRTRLQRVLTELWNSNKHV